MNLLRIQDALKNASDDQLMGLLRTPDATAPSYLVLSEIKRRKDMRAQQPEEPQGTVAEDLAKEITYNNQGIRSLREPGYEEEEQQVEDSNEGIEAMRKGGVVRMQVGGGVDGYGLNETAEEALVLENERRASLGLPLIEPVGGTPAPPEGVDIPVPPTFVPPPAAAGGAGATTGGAAATAATGGTGGTGGAGGAGGGIGSLRSGMPTLAELQQQNVQLLPGLPADLQERLRGMRTDREKERSKALNMSLVEAGLRMMASKNPSLLGSIGESAVPAVQSYAQQQAQIRKDQREDIKDELSLAQANLQRAYLAGQISASELRNRTSLLIAEAQERNAAGRAAVSERNAQIRADAARDLANQRADAALVQSAVTAAQRQMTDLGIVSTVRSEILAERRRQNPNNTDTNVTNDQIQDALVDRIIRGQNRITAARRGAAGQGRGTPDFNWDPNRNDIVR